MSGIEHSRIRKLWVNILTFASGIQKKDRYMNFIRLILKRKKGDDYRIIYFKLNALTCITFYETGY